MEKARPMMKEMDGKVVYFPPESAFLLWCAALESIFPYLYFDLAGKQLYFPPGKSINRRNENTEGVLLFFNDTDDNNPVLLNFLQCFAYYC